MPRVPTRNTTFPAPSEMETNDRPIPASSPEAITKKLYLQKTVETDQDGISRNFDEVTFLRLPGVKEITGLSKSSLYALIQEKSFPAPVRLGARTVAWVRSEVRQWAQERIRASR
jgi:predicted DNA-binding transcriptional regulator AlpA